MKSTMIRLLTLATLATSISAFAATDEPKHNDVAATSASAKQDGCADRAPAGKKEKKATTPQSDEQNKKDFDRVLMGIYG
jgi:hypothetical protein